MFFHEFVIIGSFEATKETRKASKIKMIGKHNKAIHLDRNTGKFKIDKDSISISVGFVDWLNAYVLLFNYETFKEQIT